MSNVLEFFIRMRDLTRSGLTSAVSNTHSSTTRMQRDIDNVSSANRRMGVSFDGVSGRIRQTNREMQELQRTAQRSSGSGGGFNLAGMLKLGGGVFAAAQVGSFAKDAIQKAMEYGSTEKSFGVLTGSAGKGKALAMELNQLQQSTILGPEVFKAAQTMMGFGVETQNVVKYQKMLGDVSMGNRDKFEALTLAFSQTTATGRLMGQDLLQYINAGFNPLQVMSEHWEQFGYTSKKSVGELKELMEKGEISAASITKAFEVATGAGGKFAGMMEQMAETSGGRLQILEGQYENFKIQVGNALLPFADGLMQVANNTLSWLNISKSVPQQLLEEHAGITTLLSSITSLNEGNATRHDLLEKLVRSYPDLLGKIDLENVKNSDLLTTLQNVNGQYERMISLAASDVLINASRQEFSEAQKAADHYRILAKIAETGNDDAVRNAMTFAEKAQMIEYKNSPENFLKMADIFQGQADFHGQKTRAYEGTKSIDDINSTIKQAESLTNNMELLTQHFAGNQERIAKFYEEYSKYSEFRANNPHGLPDYNFSGLRSVLDGTGLAAAASPKDILTGGGRTAGSNQSKRQSATNAAQGITGGGPRQVIINGVKFTDKIEIHQATGKESAAELEKIFAEMYMRVLNSGAKIN